MFELQIPYERDSDTGECPIFVCEQGCIQDFSMVGFGLFTEVTGSSFFYLYKNK